ncbi:hypothetical protein DSOL_1185 [Desulfosporosinus metallidurans]|uniref:Uncharacterized protein n=2 Tax=Desulfosporosinus metallidurans TaxID=1888891 RepID=A0A1Q8R0E9_9FIRM|nr:hypothetical protein DSOL_1185 [Desulfosporosinus metallidurans]
MKFGKILRHTSGNSAPLTLAIVLVVIILSCAVFEYMRLMVIASGVRDAIQSAMIDVATENWDDAYNGLREGYSGGYTLSGTDWVVKLDTGDVYSRLESTLGVKKEGTKYVKYTGPDVEYTLSDLSVSMQNAPLAPASTSGISQLSATGTVDVEVPLSFGWRHLPPLKITMKLKGGFTPKF